MTENKLVFLENISKSFGGVRALRNVDFYLGYNEVVGLVGDNGAGKSTLIKILAGVYHSDEGEIYFEGKRVQIDNPREAKNLGIETVYQDLALVNNLNVTDNIFLGRETISSGFGKLFQVLDRRKMNVQARQLLSNLGIRIESLKSMVEDLSGGQRQTVAVAKTLYLNPKVIIMDEPTAAISIVEKRKVLGFVKDLREKGISVVFISHNLEEIFSVVNRVVVLNRGVCVADCDIASTCINEVVKLMVGK